ncbi:copper resistance CopC/CopD family protein [Paenibacillus humicola]|uniref:copper resistance CopC/CopD family protein n=1 Tax=Paenibacillus humicola TaxID=3110540 RepID=UPI00237BE917|nr:copper resistance protein CopC [Paenibacillus humicola]
MPKSMKQAVISAMRRRAAWALLVLAALLVVFPSAVSAHAELEQAVPLPNSQLKAGPQEVSLSFSEGIDPEALGLEVLDSKSRSVTSAKPAISKDHKTLTLALPKLGDGVYTVSFQIISADSHPVSGSYVFVVGTPPPGFDASDFNPHAQLGHEGHEAETQVSSKQFILYAVRIAYYAALLLAAGLAIWSLFMRKKSETLAETFKKWEKLSMRALIVAVLLFVFIHANDLLSGYPSSQYKQLFLETAVGREWIALIALAAAGFATLRLHAASKAVWAAAVLGLESWVGHASVFNPKWGTVLMDFVHLTAAALWTGGLALLLALWAADRKEAGRFAARFSRVALLSIAALVLTGAGMTLLFLPSLRYLFYTAWGTLLLIKTGLVVLVIATGAFLHLRVRRGDLPAFALLRADAGLMALIIAVAAIFTYTSPLPANEPVYYHQMGTDMHMTLSISPNKPGNNEFIVKIWLPDKLGTPKSASLRLISKDRAEVGPIDVPVKPFKDTEITTFEGYVRTAYKAEGPYIPFAGKWEAEVSVMDKDDNVHVERYDFRNY